MTQKTMCRIPITVTVRLVNFGFGKCPVKDFEPADGGRWMGVGGKGRTAARKLYKRCYPSPKGKDLCQLRPIHENADSDQRRGWPAMAVSAQICRCNCPQRNSDEGSRRATASEFNTRVLNYAE